MKNYINLKNIIFIFSIFTIYSNPSNAANTISQPKATANLTSSCTVSTTDISFGNIGTLSPASTNIISSVNTLCSSGVSYNMSISLGQTGGRQLKGANKNELIFYSICQKPGWSSASGSSCTVQSWNTAAGALVSSTGTGVIQSFPLYAYVPNGFYTPDNYSDTSVVTLTY